MVLAADTGFLILLGAHNSRAAALWMETEQGNHFLVLSTLSIAEYLAFHIQRGNLADAESFVERLQNLDNTEIVAVSFEIAERSARYRIGMKLPTVDSIILTTAHLKGCELFVTTDSVFDQAAVRNLIPVELLS